MQVSNNQSKSVLVRPQKKSKQMSPGPGQVDFPVRQVTFHSHLPNGQRPRQVICQLNCKKSNLRLAQGKQNLRATCSKGKLEFKFFSSPVTSCFHKLTCLYKISVDLFCNHLQACYNSFSLYKQG